MPNSLGIWEMMDRVEPLELDIFWGLVESSKSIAKQEGLRQHEALAQILSMGPREGIARFKKRFSELSSRANNDEVYKVIGGSDDGFHYGISGLISMGRQAYEDLVGDPRGFRRRVPQYEIFEYSVNDAYEEPSRSKLQALALSRQEKKLLEGAVADPGVCKAGPRV